MTWIVTGLLVWLGWIVGDAVWRVHQGQVRCPAYNGVESCKFKAGHNGRHRAPSGAIW